MIDIIIRDCGHGEFLPLIIVTNTGRELYRGSRVASPELALERAKNVWENGGTGDVVEFRHSNCIT